MKEIDVEKFKEMKGDVANFLRTNKYNQTEILKVELKNEQALAFRMLKTFFKKEDYPKLAKMIIELGLQSMMKDAIRTTDCAIKEGKIEMLKELLKGALPKREKK